MREPTNQTHVCTRCGRRIFAVSALTLGIATQLPATAGTPAPLVAAQPAATSSAYSGVASASAGALAALMPEPATALPPVNVTGYRESYRVPASSTATGIATALIDIPLTIDAIPAALLQDQGAVTLQAALRNAPGVSTAGGEGNRDEFTIRGVQTKTDFFIDGVRDDSEYLRDLYNVREVDALQGPAALLFGRGNSGGLINLVTKAPKRLPVRGFVFQAGADGFARSTLDVGDALGSDAAYRVNAVGQRNGGDANFRDDYFEHRYGVDPEFKFWIGADTTLEVGASALHERLRADRGIPSQDGRPADVGLRTFFGSPTQNHARTRVDEAHVRFTHAVSQHLTLRDTFQVSRNNKYYENLYPGSAVATDGTLTMKGYFHGNTRTSWFNHAEMALDTQTGSLQHQFLVGLDVGRQRDTDYKVSAVSIKGVPVTDPSVVGVFDLPDRDNGAQANFQNLFAQDQISWGAHWKGLVGVAWERFKVSAQYHLLPAGSGTQHTDTAFTPRAGVIYQPVANDSMYASVSRTFTPQGSNLALSLKTPAGANLAAQTATNYEVGNKLDLFSHRLALTAALFQLDLRHVQNTDPNDPSVLVLTGAQRNRGFEFTANGELTPTWRIAANYAYLDARITSPTTSGPAGALAGLVPYNQFSIWTRHDLSAHWGLGAGLVGRSRAFTSFSDAVVLPGYVRADAMAFYQTGAWRFQLNLQNLFNRHYYSTASGDNQILPGAPRTAMLTVTGNF